MNISRQQKDHYATSSKVDKLIAPTKWVESSLVETGEAYTLLRPLSTVIFSSAAQGKSRT